MVHTRRRTAEMRVIDSHTGGEPTRVILEGGPNLGSGSLSEKAKCLAEDHMAFCRATLLEPRGQEAMVGAILFEPTDPRCLAGVIFYDAAAVLGMCGHGTIGVIATLSHLGRAEPGEHLIETPVGVITTHLNEDGSVVVTNVESRVLYEKITVNVPRSGALTGTVAYGGNTFFIVEPSPLTVDPGNIASLQAAAIATRTAVNATLYQQNLPERVDHVIFQSTSPRDGVHNRSFVLCPDDTYDRSPWNRVFRLSGPPCVAGSTQARSKTYSRKHHRQFL